MASLWLFLLTLYSTVYGSYGIIEGYLVPIEDYSFTVMLTTFGKYGFAAGAILNENWIVTAGHAVNSIYPENLVVLAATDYVDRAKEQRLNVSKIIFHEKYNNYSFAYNIALLKTAEKIRFGKKANPVKLPGQLSGKLSVSSRQWPPMTVISGFGENYESMVPPYSLHITMEELHYRECSECEKEETCICSNALDRYAGPCNGDLGDPLTYNGVLSGLYLGGAICDDFVGYGVYSNIDALRKWIDETIRNH